MDGAECVADIGMSCWLGGRSGDSGHKGVHEEPVTVGTPAGVPVEAELQELFALPA